VRPPRDEEFERLYAEHAQALYAFLSYRTGDRVLAEDLLADTFERALRARRRFDRRKASAKTWLYTIALNLMRDHHRRGASEAKALQGLADGETMQAPGAIEQVAARDLVERGLSVLAPEEREAIALRYGSELTVPEIANVTGERLTTIEGRVYRGLSKMREALDAAPAAPDSAALRTARSKGRYSPSLQRAASARSAPTLQGSSSAGRSRPGE
jgi:RNA polymerase sigma factor (sigma-70 family)